MKNKLPGNKKLVIMGTSMFAPEVLDLVEDMSGYEVTAFIENWTKKKTQEPIMGKPVIWIDDCASLVNTHEAICSLGTTHRKDFIRQVCDMGFQFATIIHPRARVSKTSIVGAGSILNAGVVVASHTTIGNHVIINRGSLIGHNTNIHDYVTVSPGANIAGAVTIGEASYIGMGAIVLDRITIGNHSVIAAGSVVTKDVPDNVQVMGIPAKIVKKNVHGR